MSRAAMIGSVSLSLVTIFVWASGSPAASAPAVPKVDFRRDIQPLLAKHCYECHGPDDESGGFRFDRRSSVKKNPRRLRPGSSATSDVYLRVASSDFGTQMPKDDTLRRDEIALIKDWIDQGAEWPDELSGDPPAAVPDPVAVAMIEAIRHADNPALTKLLRDRRAAVNGKAGDGSTPLLYAAMYGDAKGVRRLLDRGANPNIANDAGATPLMLALDDEGITTLLLDRGADVNAASVDGHTALSLAAGRLGAAPVVKLLLDRGARPSPRSRPRGAPGGLVPGSALGQAANVGNAAVFQMLVDHGADLRSALPALVLAARAGCGSCVETLIAGAPRGALESALVALAPYGDAALLARLIDRGASVNTRLTSGRRDMMDRTPLMLAASSDLIPTEAVQMLIARGADLNARGPAGETPLDLARRNGDTDVVRVLLAAGAAPGAGHHASRVSPRPAESARVALARILPVLQRSDVTFLEKTGCVSCHHNTFTAMTVAAARASRLPVDEQLASRRATVLAAAMDARRDRSMFASEVTDAVSNILAGLAAEGRPATVTTDVMAYFLKGRQLPDGRWRVAYVDHRPPIQSSDIEVTATAIRGLSVFAPKPGRSGYEQAVRRATAWLLRARPGTTDERAFQLIGLQWSGVDAAHETVRNLARALLAEQRADGGWSQLPTLTSDAYATGQALVALRESGALRASDPAYERGVRYLISTQLEDGSWYVPSRSIPFQPYFESGFPHGPDQWISMAASNWAATALAYSVAPAAPALGRARIVGR